MIEVLKVLGFMMAFSWMLGFFGEFGKDVFNAIKRKYGSTNVQKQVKSLQKRRKQNAKIN